MAIELPARTHSRRSLLLGGAAALGAGLLGGCVASSRQEYVTPDGAPVRAAEMARSPGQIRQVRLNPVAGDVDLGGLIVPTWSYGGRIPGEPIRIKAGEQLHATIVNALPAETSIHWHGLALRNDADGVPHVTQDPIGTGNEYTYRFTAPHAGTYWFHPHTGVQLDRGLYTPLIVEDPAEPLSYDSEWIVVLDDWLDGVTGTPDETLARLTSTSGGMMHGGHRGGMTSRLLGGDAGDVEYPHYLLNGRLPSDPDVHQAKPGDRVRIRFINAGSDTAFRVAVGGHRMTVTHTDGFGVRPVETDALLIGMGERYDVLVTLADGIFPLVALAEGKGATAYGLIRTGGGQTPPPTITPTELNGNIVEHSQLRAAEGAALTRREPDRTIRLELTGGMMGYDWRFNGKDFDHRTVDHALAAGERVKIEYLNSTMMFHPVHLHGHTFAVGNIDGPRKDTAIVLPHQRLTTLFDADNPGRWMIHCHNIYHAEAGMMTLLGYLAE